MGKSHQPQSGEGPREENLCASPHPAPPSASGSGEGGVGEVTAMSRPCPGHLPVFLFLQKLGWGTVCDHARPCLYMIVCVREIPGECMCMCVPECAQKDRVHFFLYI